MIKHVNINGLHFVGKFSELIVELSSIENKKLTLREYILSRKSKLN